MSQDTFQKIETLIRITTDTYFESFLAKAPKENHERVRIYYDRDVNRMTQYCCEFHEKQKPFLITEDFIKGLHKTFYPEGYIQNYTDENGKESVWMIPWEYRNIDLRAMNTEYRDIYASRTVVPREMKKITDIFNKRMNESLDKGIIREIILLFIIDYIFIHPFSDGNGRVGAILSDLLCYEYNVKPFYFYKIRKKDRKGLDIALNEFRASQNIIPFYEFIEKYSN